VGRLAVRIGAMEHWLQALNQIAHMESLVKKGKAVRIHNIHGKKVVDYHYEYMTPKSKMTVLIEWQFQGKRKRLDYAMINATEICVTDLAGQLGKWRKRWPPPHAESPAENRLVCR